MAAATKPNKGWGGGSLQNTFREEGATGLNQYSGYIQDDFEKAMQGSRGAKKLREMSLSSAVIAASLFGYRQMLLRPKWTVQPASEKANDVAAAEFVEQCLGDMRHTEAAFRNEQTSYLIYGWSWFEQVLKRRRGQIPDKFVADMSGQGMWVRSNEPTSMYDDGKIGWHAFAPRSQEGLDHWQFSDKGELIGLWHSPPPDYKTVLLGLAKCLHFTTNTMRENPEGVSIIRPCYRPYRLSQRIEEAEAIGVARNLHGFPVLITPAELDLFDASDPKMVSLLTDAKKLITNIKRDEQMGAVLPFGWELQLLSVSGSPINTNEILDRYHARMAMAMLVQFLLLGMERGGAYELAKQQQSLWLHAVKGYQLGILAEINLHAIPLLIGVNDFGELSGYPEVQADDITEPDITALADYVSKLTQAGQLTSSPATEEALRSRGGLPELEEDYQALPPMAESPAAENPENLAPTEKPEPTAAQKRDRYHELHFSIKDVLEKGLGDQIEREVSGGIDDSFASR